jgi:hypothetical protein
LKSFIVVSVSLHFSRLMSLPRPTACRGPQKSGIPFVALKHCPRANRFASAGNNRRLCKKNPTANAKLPKSLWIGHFSGSSAVPPGAHCRLAEMIHCAARPARICGCCAISPSNYCATRASTRDGAVQRKSRSGTRDIRRAGIKAQVARRGATWRID